MSFSQRLYDANDMRAKKAMVEYFLRKRLYIQSFEDFNIDITTNQIKDGGYELRAYHELSINNRWHGEYCRFEKIFVPYRKVRLFNKYDVEKMYFWILNSSVERAIVTKGTVVKNSKVIKKDLGRGPNEKFFQVDIDHFNYKQIKETPCHVTTYTNSARKTTYQQSLPGF